VTFGDIAGIASELAGRDIRRVVMDDDEWAAGQVAHGTPEFMARFLLGTFQAAREGRFTGVDPLLGELLGRKPRTCATCSPSAWTRPARAKRLLWRTERGITCR
jgi:NAD(P)H dehydrogenase (quinone)